LDGNIIASFGHKLAQAEQPEMQLKGLTTKALSSLISRTALGQYATHLYAPLQPSHLSEYMVGNHGPFDMFRPPFRFC
jgi:hypothetical protein